MNRNQVNTVGINCTNQMCQQLDVANQRCRLVCPVGRQGIKWIFALDNCPISLAYADAVAMTDEKQNRRLLNPKSRVSARAQYRLVALTVHEREPANSRMIIDAVVEQLQRRPTETTDAMVQRIGLVLDRPRAEPHRVNPVAGAALLLALVFFALALLRLIDPSPANLPRQELVVRPTIDLTRAPADEPFYLDLRLNKPLYVSVYWLPSLGQPERLFPPLAAPLLLPWPLKCDQPDQTYRIPAHGSFRRPKANNGFLLVFWHEGFSPDPYDVLANLRRDPETLKAAFEKVEILAVGDP